METIVDVINRVALKQSNQPAIIEGNEVYTFAELVHRSASVAYHLSQFHSNDQPIIALCLPRGFELISALLGVWMVNAVYLPLDIENPDERLKTIINDAKPQIIITNGLHISRFQEVDVDLINVEALIGDALDVSRFTTIHDLFTHHISVFVLLFMR